MTLEERVNEMYTDYANRKITLLDSIRRVVEEELKARLGEQK